MALAKARELRDVITDLEDAHAKKKASLAVALDDADVNVAEESEDEGNEGSEKEKESAQETCLLAFEAATNVALKLRGEDFGHRAGDPTRLVQSRSKRQVTADEKAAESIEKSALALELICEVARVGTVALDNVKAEYTRNFIGMGSSLALTCGAYCCIMQLPLQLSAQRGCSRRRGSTSSKKNCAVLERILREEFAAARGGDHKPKVHLIELHVAKQARRHGTFGMFGD